MPDSVKVWRINWTQEMDQVLIDNYWDIPPQRMADMIGGISERAVKTRLRNLGLIVPKERIAERVRLSRIQPGNVPWNTGKKIGSHPNSVATQFKKGQKPANTRYEGHISYRLDKDINRWYCHIRVNGKYLHLQRVVWERANGPIPSGMLIRFINGNSLDCRLCNLEMISRREHAIRNTNREKHTASMKEYWKNGPSDKHISGFITRDKTLREELEKMPEIIEIKRLQLQLRKAINNETQLNRATT
ncbi:HNH endonuclease [bacterium]|nr:HNH endonuclease [bacterium]